MSDKWICIKEHKTVGETQKGIDKTCHVGTIYYLEEVPLDRRTSFWHVSDETNYIGIIFKLDCFITLAEWRENQINSILDD